MSRTASQLTTAEIYTALMHGEVFLLGILINPTNGCCVESSTNIL